ncbi:MAG: serine hydrolase [Oscillospiraceae bacterium]|nr:serine hydrolase [Oscillospiraceae bacterium]
MQLIQKMIVKNILPVILSVLFVLAVLPGFTVSAEDNDIKIHMKTEGLESPPDITANAAVILNTETGNIVYEKNSQRLVYPASTVKIMTAILVLENVSDLSAKIIISRYVADNIAGNRLDPKISEGEIFTVEDLLNAMLLQGANEAALALAEFVSGTVSDFVAEMNKKAVELGCVNTVFTNPTGMHSEDMHTTASDMAKIAFYASKIQKFMDITDSTKYTVSETNKEREERPLLNRNHFISKAQQTQYYYEYASGINYGSTQEAGYCLTTIAEQTGLYYLCVLMGATSTVIPDTGSERLNCFSDAKSLLEWAFSIYSYKTVISAKDKSCSVEVKLSANRDNITLIPDEDRTALLPQNIDMEKEITTEREIYEEDLIAPIDKGQVLGKLTAFYNGEAVGTVNLISTADVERSNILYILDQIKGVVSGSWFRASVIIFIIIFAFYVVINLLRKNKKEQKRFY